MASNEEEGEERKRNREKRTELLPHDLIIEILLNLPVISLLRFKCVCKLWYNLILSPDFIATHHKNNKCKNEVSLFCYSCNHNTIHGPPPANTVMSFRFNSTPLDDVTIPVKPAGKLQIVGCCNGVVCLSRPPHHDGLVLWNPATRQFRQYGIYDRTSQTPVIPSYPGFCFHPIAKTFKLVRLAFFPLKTAQISIIFTSHDNSSKQKTMHFPFQLPGSGSGRAGSLGPAVSVKTCMYWDVYLARRAASQEEADQYVLCFDMIDEMFKQIELPHEAKLSPSALTNMVGYKDGLAMFVPKRAYPGSGYCPSFDVWVMNDQSGGDQSWSKKLTCQAPVGFARALGFFIKDNVDWIVMSTHSGSANCLYDPETKKTMELPLEDRYPRFFAYSESLVSLN